MVYETPPEKETPARAWLQNGSAKVAGSQVSAMALKLAPFQYRLSLFLFRLMATAATPLSASSAKPWAPGVPFHCGWSPGVVLLELGGVKSKNTGKTAVVSLPAESMAVTVTVCSPSSSEASATTVE